MEDTVKRLVDDNNYQNDPQVLFGSIEYFTAIYDWVTSQKNQLSTYVSKLPKTGSAAYEGGPLPGSAPGLMHDRYDAFKGNKAIFKCGARERGNPKAGKSSKGKLKRRQGKTGKTSAGEEE
ncbi:unnamed protein product, partial [Ectocarpus sp. 12 AP-2014]